MGYEDGFDTNDPRYHRYLGMSLAISTLLRYRGNSRTAVEGRKHRERLIEGARQWCLHGDASYWKAAVDEYGPLSVQSTKGRGRPPKLPEGDDLNRELESLGEHAAGKAARKYHVTQSAIRQRKKQK